MDDLTISAILIDPTDSDTKKYALGLIFSNCQNAYFVMNSMISMGKLSGVDSYVDDIYESVILFGSKGDIFKRDFSQNNQFHVQWEGGSVTMGPGALEEMVVARDGVAPVVEWINVHKALFKERICECIFRMSISRGSDDYIVSLSPNQPECFLIEY
jgi:hypothetical protein